MINLSSFVELSMYRNNPLKSVPPFSCALKNTSVADPRFVLLNLRLPAPGYVKLGPEEFVSTSKLYFTEPDANAPSAPEVPEDACPNVTDAYPVCASVHITFV